MSTISAIDSASKTSSAAPTKKPGTDPALAKAAKEFESVLVKQLLQASKVVGAKTDGGYEAMALDAMVTGVMKGGGLGLARSLEASLSQAMPHKTVSLSATLDNPRPKIDEPNEG